MVKKTIAGILIFAGVFGGIVLLTYAGPIYPHIFGPIVVVAIGTTLLLVKPGPVKK